MDLSSKKSFAYKVLTFALALILALTLSPLQSVAAYAATDKAADSAADSAASDSATDSAASDSSEQIETAGVVEPLETGTVMGGSVVTKNGTYNIAKGSTGTITVGEGVDVTFVGQGITTDAAYTDLSIKVGNNSKLTIKDVYITSTDRKNPSLIDFDGKGSLAIEGENILEIPTTNEFGSLDVFSAVIHVDADADVTFCGSGVLYGYKTSLGSFIGENAEQNSDEACGNITFESGTWCIKGSATGPLIGGNNANGDCGTITIKGGELYLKAVAAGAAIGCSSNSAAAPNVVISGGTVEIMCDWIGSAIGNGGKSTTADSGKLTISGGSLKTFITKNALQGKRWSATIPDGLYSAITSEVVTASAQDASGNAVYQSVFDASDYADKDAIKVTYNGTTRYNAKLPSLVTNEMKNPSSNYTPDNWLENDAKNMWNGASGSSFAKDENLYLWLPKDAKTIEVCGDVYQCIFNEQTQSFDFKKGGVSTESFSGETRIETAISAATSAYPQGAEGVILASGENFPDALSASTLAGALDYPILLVDGKSTDEVLKAVTETLSAKKVIVVGGEAAVSKDIYKAFESKLGAGNIERLSGDTRYETQMKIYNYGKQFKLWQGAPIIATGSNYPDALSISSYAAYAKAPIFLVDADTSISSDVLAALSSDYTGKNAVIVGGPAAVTKATENAVSAATKATAVRLQGGTQTSGRTYTDDRYGTSAAIADYCLAQGMKVSSIGFATGSNYPDALAAGPVQAKSAGIVLLVADGYTTSAITLLNSCESDDFAKAVFYGGTAAIPQTVRDEVLKVLNS